MDRRQRKTREAIFKAFCSLLKKKSYDKITVGEIIEVADIGRATFYSHFETKDYLLKELCTELFCHIFDSINGNNSNHRHIFECDEQNSVFAHLFSHFKKNDNNILELLSSQNNGVFLKYFEENLSVFIQSQFDDFKSTMPDGIPRDFWINHISSTFTHTLKWWVHNGMKQSVNTIDEYFLKAIGNFEKF